MKTVCNQCHARPLIARVYRDAEQVVASTNAKVQRCARVSRTQAPATESHGPAS